MLGSDAGEAGNALLGCDEASPRALCSPGLGISRGLWRSILASVEGAHLHSPGAEWKQTSGHVRLSWLLADCKVLGIKGRAIGGLYVSPFHCSTILPPPKGPWPGMETHINEVPRALSQHPCTLFFVPQALIIVPSFLSPRHPDPCQETPPHPPAGSQCSFNPCLTSHRSSLQPPTC